MLTIEATLPTTTSSRPIASNRRRVRKRLHWHVMRDDARPAIRPGIEFALRGEGFKRIRCAVLYGLIRSRDMKRKGHRHQKAGTIPPQFDFLRILRHGRIDDERLSQAARATAAI